MDSPENPSGQVVGVEQDATPTPMDVDTAVLLLGAGVTAITHPLLYVKLLIQVGHEPLPPTVGTTMFGRRVLYLPGFFSYAQHIVKVDGRRGLFRGLSPRIVSSTISTVVRSKVKQQVEVFSKRDDLQTSLRKVVRETSHEMIIQCLSRVATHPFHVMSVRCMAQFVGRELKYGGIFSCIVKIFKEEGLAGFYVVLCVCSGLVPHVVGEVLFLWCCNLLAHFINTYAVDENFSQASAVRSYTKFVMGIAVSVLTYPFMLVADLMAVNNCGLAAGLPPHSPIFKSWLHCWNHLSHKGYLFRGSSFFFRRVPVTSQPCIED
ncbi:mitochondrial carrier homolog 1-like isoform X1 [Epinephelus lanceolatus]|uniref:mitochondrial carrier homolog 1-like isoform X2 n=1 Tax=Epinephelus lanceolatus TaxID=310571 RepID=UPI0014486E9A|nr:mitochondrial carrier homolog 1-like isoform X2 [Epinephelus lanceolatus]